MESEHLELSTFIWSERNVKWEDFDEWVNQSIHNLKGSHVQHSSEWEDFDECLDFAEWEDFAENKIVKSDFYDEPIQHSSDKVIKQWDA